MLLIKVCPLFPSTRIDKMTQLLCSFPLALPLNMGDFWVNHWKVLCFLSFFFLVVGLLFSLRLTLLPLE